MSANASVQRIGLSAYNVYETSIITSDGQFDVLLEIVKTKPCEQTIRTRAILFSIS